MALLHWSGAVLTARKTSRHALKNDINNSWDILINLRFCLPELLQGCSGLTSAGPYQALNVL